MREQKTLLNGKIVRLKSAQISSAVGGGHPFMSGIISNRDKDWITINLYDGKCLIVERILNEKNENILKNIKIGDRFFTGTFKKLAFAKSIRSKFNTLGLKKKINKLQFMKKTINRQKIVIITGGLGFLGVQHAQAVLEGGNYPILIDVNIKIYPSLKKYFKKNFSHSINIEKCDITKINDVKHLKKKIISKYKKIDALIK